MIEKFYLTHRADPNRYYQSGLECTLAIKGNSTFPKAPVLELQHKI